MATRTNTKRKLVDEPELLTLSVPLSPAELRDKIAERAYGIFLARNGYPGDATSDWLLAEQEVCNAFAAVPHYSDNVLSITSVVTKRKQNSSTKPITRRSSTPKSPTQTRSRKQKEAKG